MKLSQELIDCECNESPDAFRAQLIDLLETEFSDRTIDGVMCRPEEALDFGRRVRDLYNNEELHDAIVLKTLLNIRKSKHCPRGLKTSGGRRNYKSELADAGCQVNYEEFRWLVTEALCDMYKDQTVDGLLSHPAQAKQYCRYVRRKAECYDLSDYLILSVLLNVRKSPGT